MKKIAYISTSRADRTIYKPILKRIEECPELALRPDMLQPDIVLALGDRLEMLERVIKYVPMGVPIAHIHGGEISEGSMDERIRHAITKLSHLHFAATEEYAARIVQMGEEPWRVYNVGAPSLDNILDLDLYEKQFLAESGFNFPLAIATFHPDTLFGDNDITPCLNALVDTGINVIITEPNADHGHEEIQKQLWAFNKRLPNVVLFEELGAQLYFSLMKHAEFIIGNSSSGIIEAPSFKLPVINIGPRQDGRMKALNIIDCAMDEEEIFLAIRTARSQRFRDRLCVMRNPYGDGKASDKIVSILCQHFDNEKLLRKKFYDIK